jgi:hypothetical protein
MMPKSSSEKELRAERGSAAPAGRQRDAVLLQQHGVGPMSAAQLVVSWSHQGLVPG